MGTYQLSENDRACSGQSRWHNFLFGFLNTRLGRLWPGTCFFLARIRNGGKIKFRFGNTIVGAGNIKFDTGNTTFGPGNTRFGSGCLK